MDGLVLKLVLTPALGTGGERLVCGTSPHLWTDRLLSGAQPWRHVRCCCRGRHLGRSHLTSCLLSCLWVDRLSLRLASHGRSRLPCLRGIDCCIATPDPPLGAALPDGGRRPCRGSPSHARMRQSLFVGGGPA